MGPAERNAGRADDFATVCRGAQTCALYLHGLASLGKPLCAPTPQALELHRYHTQTRGPLVARGTN